MSTPRGRRSDRRGDGDGGGGGLGPLLAQYLRERNSLTTGFLGFVRDRNPHVFGHHDCTQSDYLDHVWRCGGLYICRGCTAVIVTGVAALALAMVTRWPVRIPTLAVAICFGALLLVALLPLRGSPRTLLHDLRRATLGALLGSAVAYLFLCDDWPLRAIVVGVWIAVVVARRVWRGIVGRGVRDSA